MEVPWSNGLTKEFTNVFTLRGLSFDPQKKVELCKLNEKCFLDQKQIPRNFAPEYTTNSSIWHG